MLASRTTGEKRLIFIFAWVLVGVLYFHVRITGGLVPDVVNRIAYPDATPETRKVDHVIMPYRESRLALDQELAQLKTEIASDQEIVTEMAASGNDGQKLALRVSQNKDLEQRLTAAVASQQRLGARLVRKAGAETEVAQLQSQIAQLAAKTGLTITGTQPVLTAEALGIQELSATGTRAGEVTRAVDDSPVVTPVQVKTLLGAKTLVCQKYTLEGNSVMLFVFLQQLKKLPWDIYVLNLDVSKEAGGDRKQAGSPRMEMVLVY